MVDEHDEVDARATSPEGESQTEPSPRHGKRGQQHVGRQTLMISAALSEKLGGITEALGISKIAGAEILLKHYLTRENLEVYAEPYRTVGRRPSFERLKGMIGAL